MVFPRVSEVRTNSILFVIGIWFKDINKGEKKSLFFKDGKTRLTVLAEIQA